ncbi:MAG: hypothetical protein JW751_29225 [Polyangiaceae bacterium]|nr:hypothetical protein [Polyangiaceae bacterium]
MFDSLPLESLWLGLLGALGVVFGWHWLARRLDAWRRRRRARRALAAEDAARVLLARHGFLVTHAQAAVDYHLLDDGRPVKVELRADYLVEKAGERLVAEVKTGSRVTRLRHGPTRRQLLEYQLAFAADGVVLVDMEHSRVRRVRFPLGGHHR